MLVSACTLVGSMATRSIVTSQPDVACDVCGRRLLRGEHPEEFLAGAERRLVCELCAPRAAHEGWRRAADVAESLTLEPSRRSRGVSLLDRLRQLREPAWRREGAPAREPMPGTGEPDLSDEALEQLVRDDMERFSSTGEDERVRSAPAPAGTRERRGHRSSSALTGAFEVQRVLEVFNASEHPRRVGGVARSLGAPTVTVRRSDGASGRRFTIVVAWELCWYRYAVDLDDEQSGALLEGNGMELSELPDEDKMPNALADEHGALALVG